jgi:hypothetical protein
MAKGTTDFEKKLADVVKERQRLEGSLMKEQEKLRKIDRQAEPQKYADALGPVNEAKAKIGAISQEHVELARMVSVMKGGQNFQPPQ